MITTASTHIPAHATIDALVTAYNARQADAFAALFHSDAEITVHLGEVQQRSRAEIESHYRGLFLRHPAARDRARRRGFPFWIAAEPV